MEVALPYIMDFNIPACLPKFATIAETMGENILHLSQRDAASRVLVAVVRLMKDIGMPTSLREQGVDKSDMEKSAREVSPST